MPRTCNSGPLTDSERAELERLRTAVEASGNVIYEWDIASDAISWSRAASQTFGLPESIDISTLAQFVTRISSEDLPAITRMRKEHIEGRSPFRVEYRLRRGDGTFCWVQDNGVVERADDGRPERVIGTIHVITSHKQREAHLEWLASYDELTGHYNRNRLRDALQHTLAYADRYGASGTFLAVAIDDLPRISDVYGHEVADAAIIAVGQALDQCLRASDVIGRMAPDKFGVIISACPEKDVQITAEKILATAHNAAANLESGPIHLTTSIGGVTFPGIVRTAHAAMIKADVALEEARRAGHNIFVTYNLSEEQRQDRRRSLATAKKIQTALQNDGLRLAFQPVVRSDTREVDFRECLLRMHEGGDKYTAAGAFVGVAEEMGLVRLIDRRVLELAVDELYASPDITLAINISGLTTTDPAWLRSLIAHVKGKPHIARRIVIEITETAALHDIDGMVRFASAVREVGCRVALDDFGAGYTSFRHLKALAVDIVKIDGSFITNLVDQPQDFLFVKTLQDLALGFGLKTVAECVETEEVAALLAAEGVHYLQGYHFGKPSFDRPWRRDSAAADDATPPTAAPLTATTERKVS